MFCYAEPSSSSHETTFFVISSVVSLLSSINKMSLFRLISSQRFKGKVRFYFNWVEYIHQSRYTVTGNAGRMHSSLNFIVRSKALCFLNWTIPKIFDRAASCLFLIYPVSNFIEFIPCYGPSAKQFCHYWMLSLWDGKAASLER